MRLRLQIEVHIHVLCKVCLRAGQIRYGARSFTKKSIASLRQLASAQKLYRYCHFSTFVYILELYNLQYSFNSYEKTISLIFAFHCFLSVKKSLPDYARWWFRFILVQFHSSQHWQHSLQHSMFKLSGLIWNRSTAICSVNAPILNCSQLVVCSCMPACNAVTVADWGAHSCLMSFTCVQATDQIWLLPSLLHTEYWLIRSRREASQKFFTKCRNEIQTICMRAQSVTFGTRSPKVKW